MYDKKNRSGRNLRRKGQIIIFIIPMLFFAYSVFISSFNFFPDRIMSGFGFLMPATPIAVTSPFLYSFNVDGVADERKSMNDSRSPYWWVNSGGELRIMSGIGSTIVGDLPKYSKWRLEYASSNPVDTDNGFHPQNIFRLVLRQKWLSYTQDVYFRILRDNLSHSPNRNESNGLFLFNRYQDGENLYYVGVRVDGQVVIKKKVNGVYHTLAERQIFSGDPYDRQTNPNLLPKNQWLGIRAEVKNQDDGSVYIAAYLDIKNNQQWVKVLDVVDRGISTGPAIKTAGYTGIRSDFMDVEFKDYKITSY